MFGSNLSSWIETRGLDDVFGSYWVGIRRLGKKIENSSSFIKNKKSSDLSQVSSSLPNNPQTQKQGIQFQSTKTDFSQTS
jgi:hypothetical protein